MNLARRDVMNSHGILHVPLHVARGRDARILPVNELGSHNILLPT